MSLDTNTWTTRSPMPEALLNHFCAARAREVYVMAGYSSRGSVDDVNIFNIDSGDWRIGELFISWLHHIINLPFVPLKPRDNIKYF